MLEAELDTWDIPKMDQPKMTKAPKTAVRTDITSTLLYTIPGRPVRRRIAVYWVGRRAGLIRFEPFHHLGRIFYREGSILWERCGRCMATAVFLGVVLGFLSIGTVGAQPLSQVQGELARIVQEIARVEETAADLAVRASTAADFGTILEIELQNFGLERKLLELTDALLAQEGAFLSAKPELLDLTAKGEAKPIQLLIQLEELIAKAKAALAAAWGWSAKVEENLVNRKKKLLSLPGTQTSCCVTFDALPMNAVYHVGDTLSDCARMRVQRFQWSNGTWTNTGYAAVIPAALAGGSGKELNLNNVNLVFDFGRPIKGLVIRFGEYGGNLNIMINGTFRNFANFQDIAGNWGGVQVTVTGGNGNDKGVVKIKGEIKDFYLGGQELYIDDICPVE